MLQCQSLVPLRYEILEIAALKCLETKVNSFLNGIQSYTVICVNSPSDLVFSPTYHVS